MKASSLYPTTLWTKWTRQTIYPTKWTPPQIFFKDFGKLAGTKKRLLDVFVPNLTILTHRISIS